MKNNPRFIFMLGLILATATAYADPRGLSQLLSEIKQSQNNAVNSAALVILVNKDKVLINAHLGKTNWVDDKSFTREHTFRIGSISKSFAALLAMRMSEAGKLDIHLPFSHYVKRRYIENNFAKTTVTIEQLLEHTSGLAGLSAREWKYNKSDELTIEQALDLKTNVHRLRWKPGLHHSYSNAGFGLLGLALEKAGGTSYENLMYDYVFKPLAMKSSTLLLDKNIKATLITGYDTDGKTIIPYWHNIYRPFAAVNTNADDMIKFLQMLLNDGKTDASIFLSKQSIKRIETPKTSLSAKSGLLFGYGLANYTWQRNGVPFRGHGGDADGYLSRYGYNRESGLGYFVMVNTFNYKSIGKLRYLLEDYVSAKVKQKKASRFVLSKDRMKEYAGNYVSVTHRFKGKETNRLKVFQRDHSLYIQEGSGAASKLFAVTEKHFSYFNETAATIAFIRHEGTLFFQGDIGNYRKTLTTTKKTLQTK